FVALPVFVVVGTEINNVLARNIGWTTGRREHFALHGRFNFARDLYQKLFPNAPWLGMLVSGLEQVFAGFTVDPSSYRFQQAQSDSSVSSIKFYITFIDPPAIGRIWLNLGAGVFHHLHFDPVVI